MSETQPYPKRLIEVDLPIRGISTHARREKAIRQGHISTLHIWWARRPMGACRAVACAALWLDPADRNSPSGYVQGVALLLQKLAVSIQAEAALATLFGSQWSEWRRRDSEVLAADTAEGRLELRQALLDLLVPLASWEATENTHLLEVAQALTVLAHRFSVGAGGHERPIVLDPFAGGGTIPVESLRVGAEAIAGDLNPVAALLNRVLIEYGPRFGERLPKAVSRWGDEVSIRAVAKLARYYPGGGAMGAKDYPSAYLWARTIACEGPDCGIRYPLLRSLWLVKKEKKSVFVDIRVADGICFVQPREGMPPRGSRGTISKGAALCPACGFTTPVERVREQLTKVQGGSDTALLYAVVWSGGQVGKIYRAARSEDFAAVELARQALQERTDRLLPDEPTPNDGTGSLGGGYRTRKYGIDAYRDFFNSRQRLALKTFTDVLLECAPAMRSELGEDLGTATHVCLALAIDRCVNQLSSFSKWNSGRELVDGVFARQAIPMLWDFGELNPIDGQKSYWQGAVAWVADALARTRLPISGQALQGSATALPFPDDSVDMLFSDPPYYDAVPYAELADFFWVWLRRSLPANIGIDIAQALTPKADECVVNMVVPRDASAPKDSIFFERTMTKALTEARRVVKPTGVGTIVFAHKSTAGWEAQLQAMLEAGWVVTASWPIDTEMGNRLRAQNSAALGSSVHLVCRPRESAAGRLDEGSVGAWREVLLALPIRIKEWLPRLASEGVVGADAIFACLGPALEIFSRFAVVEKVNGEKVDLKEYLLHVWAAVAREAMSMIFDKADATDLEPDARLTAMWLWTLSAGPSTVDAAGDHEPAGDEDEEPALSTSAGAEFVLEFDAARKIAQGLGANLEALSHVVAVRGDKAILLPVVERTNFLFGKVAGVPTAMLAAKKKQMTLFAELDEVAESQGWGEVGAPKAGTTTLDRVHQAMLLFASGRSEAMKRFLIDEGAGNQPQFWQLAQSLAALYPTGCEEKRWVDGVLARKKGLGFG